MGVQKKAIKHHIRVEYMQKKYRRRVHSPPANRRRSNCCLLLLLAAAALATNMLGGVEWVWSGCGNGLPLCSRVRCS